MNILDQMKAKKIDYYYNFSDDNRAWRKGLQQESELLTALRELGAGTATQYIETYVPELFQEYYKTKFYNNN